MAKRYIDADKLAEMLEAKADTLIEGKEAFLYVRKWLDLLPSADVVPRETVEQIFAEIDMLFIKDLGKHYGYPIYAFNKDYYELLKKKYTGGENDE